MEGYNINDSFPNNGNWKYKGETIKDVLKKDSGYIKDLIKKHKYFCLSEKCMLDAQEMTKGFYDKWTKPEKPTNNIFDSLRVYTAAYDFDFNNEEIVQLNNTKLST